MLVIYIYGVPLLITGVAPKCNATHTKLKALDKHTNALHKPTHIGDTLKKMAQCAKLGLNTGQHKTYFILKKLRAYAHKCKYKIN
jgi:hypothetical protein